MLCDYVIVYMISDASQACDRDHGSFVALVQCESPYRRDLYLSTRALCLLLHR